jgi:hypothetical protein
MSDDPTFSFKNKYFFHIQRENKDHSVGMRFVWVVADSFTDKESDSVLKVDDYELSLESAHYIRACRLLKRVRALCHGRTFGEQQHGWSGPLLRLMTSRWLHGNISPSKSQVRTRQNGRCMG